MTELPDDELDKLFRKSSEELDPTYEPENWDALSRRLDQADGKRPAGWLWKWVPLGLLFLLIPAGLMIYYGSDKPRSLVTGNHKNRLKKTEIQVRKEKQQTGTLNPEKKPDTEKIQIENTEKSDGSNIITKDKAAQKYEGDTAQSFEKKGINKMAKTLPRSRSKAGGVYLEPNSSKRKGGYGASSFEKNELKFTGDKRSVEVIVNKYAEEKNIDKITAQPARKDEPNSGTPENKDFAIAPPAIDGGENGRSALSAAILNHLPFNQKTGLSLPAVRQPESVEVPEPARQNDLSPKFAVRFGYSPDLSTVGFKNYSRPGKAVSLLAEYAVLKKLYIQTGVIGSIKEYSANAGEYMLKKYVTDIAIPTTIDGTCNMIEIPLGIRYDITQKERSRWFAGTGLSSFYTQKEKYTYNYTGYVYNPKYGWEGKTGWFLFSHLNVSAGYEHRISNKLSILAEPYIKVPLKGIGYGKVNLMTTGMWLSIRYTPVFK